MKRKSALYSHSARNLPNRDRLADAAVLDRNHEAFEDLNSLFAAFTYLNRRLYRVAWPNLRKVRFQGRLVDAVEDRRFRHDDVQPACAGFRLWHNGRALGSTPQLL